MAHPKAQWCLRFAFVLQNEMLRIEEQNVCNGRLNCCAVWSKFRESKTTTIIHKLNVLATLALFL